MLGRCYLPRGARRPRVGVVTVGKLDTVKTVIDLANTVHSAIIAAKDERARRETEKRAAEDKEKDRKIKELKAKLAEKGTT